MCLASESENDHGQARRCARRVVYRKNLLGVRRKMVGLGFPSRGRRICYGRQGELATNSREQQEIVTLSLQLLQNCLMLITQVPGTCRGKLIMHRHRSMGIYKRVSQQIC